MMILGFKGLETARKAASEIGFEVCEDADQRRWMLKPTAHAPTNVDSILKPINLSVIETLSEFGFQYLGKPEQKTNGFSSQDFLVKAPSGY